MVISKDQFQKVFLSALIEYFGSMKVPDLKRLALWEKLGSYPVPVLEESAKKIVLKFGPNNFPDYDKIQELVTEVNNGWQLERRHRGHKSSACGRCSSGVRIVDNYAFRCPCPMGLENFPTHPEYTGQAPFKEKYWETETDKFRETRNYIYRTCKATLKQYAVSKENPWKDHSHNGVEVEWDNSKRNEKQDSKSTYMNKFN